MFKSVLFNDFESMLLQKLNLIFRFQKNHDFSFFTLAADLQLLAAPGPVSEFLNAFSESLLAPPWNLKFLLFDLSEPSISEIAIVESRISEFPWKVPNFFSLSTIWNYNEMTLSTSSLIWPSYTIRATIFEKVYMASKNSSLYLS